MSFFVCFLTPSNLQLRNNPGNLFGTVIILPEAYFDGQLWTFY